MTSDVATEPSLFGSDRTEDLSGNDVLRFFAAVDTDRAQVAALETPGTHLIEGSRGTGKSMLMRYVHEKLSLGSDQGRVSVFISFSRYLASYNPSARRRKGYSPFQNWLFAKLLVSIEEQVRNRRGGQQTGNVFGTFPVQNYIARLETHYRDANVADPAINAQSLGVEEREILDFAQPDYFKQRVLSILDTYHAKHLVLLLDEAAQSFAEELQPEFFQVIKQLRDSRIAIKAAVYPHTTNYGSDFDVGQDAIILRIERPVEESEGMQFFYQFIEKRFTGTHVIDVLNGSPTVRDFLIKMSGGNPRWFIHLLSATAISEGNAISATKASGAAKEFTSTTLWPYLRNLRERLKSKRRFVDVAEHLMHTFVAGLRDMNRARRPDGKSRPTCFVAVSDHKTVPYRVHAALKLLQYSGMLSPRGRRKISARETAELYLLHPAIQVRENTIFPSEPNPPIERTASALTDPPREQFKEYTRNSPGLVDLGREEDELANECQTCDAPLKATDRFCSACGSPVIVTSPFEELRAASVQELELTPGIKQRLVADDRFRVVGDVIDASDAHLDSIEMIGPARIKIIRYAAEEFISG